MRAILSPNVGRTLDRAGPRRCQGAPPPAVAARELAEKFQPAIRARAASRIGGLLIDKQTSLQHIVTYIPIYYQTFILNMRRQSCPFASAHGRHGGASQSKL